MKLYTEKQVIRLLERYKSDWYRILPPNKIINLENEIELPSDEEIEQLADACHPFAEQIGGDIYVAYRAFKQGAKKLRDKIKENQ